MKAKLPLSKPVRIVSGLIYAASVPVIIALIYQGLLYSKVKEEHMNQTSTWAAMEDAYSAVEGKQEEFRAKRDLFRELGAWNRIRIGWYEVLTAIKEQLPPTIYPLSIRSEGILDDVGGPDSHQIEVGRHFSFTMSCQTTSEATSEQIVDFVRSLRKSHVFNGYWHTVNMGTITPDKRNPEAGVKVFRVYANGEERRFKQ